MKDVVKIWLERYLSDPEAVLLVVLLFFAILLVSTTGTVLAPVFAGLVIAYLLEGLVERLEKLGMFHWLAVALVFVLFLGGLIIATFFMFPLFINQVSTFTSELPVMLTKAQSILMQLPERYPEFVSEDQIDSFLWDLKQSMGKFGKAAVSFSIASIPGLIGIIIYLVLVPLVVFFFLLDRDAIIHWITRFLPHKRNVMKTIWSQVNVQLGNYVRGKVLEIFIVAIVSYIAFILLKLEYAFLLSVLVGLSVLIPFIGVTIVTIPVVIVAFLQWGWGSDFAWLVVVYTIICLLDANLLVPILFSEAVNLHPIAIIVAILFFGGLWGFWGVFFAIPLASLVQAIINAWPQRQLDGAATTQTSI